MDERNYTLLAADVFLSWKYLRIVQPREEASRKLSRNRTAFVVRRAKWSTVLHTGDFSQDNKKKTLKIAVTQQGPRHMSDDIKKEEERKGLNNNTRKRRSRRTKESARVQYVTLLQAACDVLEGLVFLEQWTLLRSSELV